MRILHRPVTVSLQITARDGSSSSRRQTIGFRDPVENVVVAYSYNVGQRPDGPGFTEPLGAVSSDDHCDSRSAQQKAGLAALKLRPSTLGAQPGLLQESGNDATVSVGVPCLYARLGCDGILELDAVNPSRRPNAKPRELGVARFVARPGRGSATVKIKLNAYGSALARAHKLRRVMLRLLSAGSNGKTTATSRSIIIVGGRTGRR